MYCYMPNEFFYLMEMLKQGNNFTDYNHLNNFIDKEYLELRYMKKRFGYLFFDDLSYIKKFLGNNAIYIHKEKQFVARNPEEPYYHDRDENNNPIDISIPENDTDRYEIKLLHEIDKGPPYFTKEEKKRDVYIKETTNILQKINLLKPEVYDTNEFYNVLTEDYDRIELGDIKDFYKVVKQYVLKSDDDEVINIERI